MSCCIGTLHLNSGQTSARIRANSNKEAASLPTSGLGGNLVSRVSLCSLVGTQKRTYTHVHDSRLSPPLNLV